MTLELVTYIVKPIQGNWDGGAKNYFTWTLGRVQKDKKGYFVRINGFEANHWFHVAQGKTERQTLGYALRIIKKHLERNGTPVTFYEYLNTNN